MGTLPSRNALILIGRVQKSEPLDELKMSVSYPKSTSNRLLAGKLAPEKCRIKNLI